MTATPTTAQFITCECDAKPEPHKVPVPRIVVASTEEANAEAVRSLLESVWYDLTLFFGPDIPLYVAYDGEATGIAEAACEWADAQGFAVGPYDGGFVAAYVAPEGVKCAPADGRPTYVYVA
ncbi:hypothetical protein [Streptomyces sp.]|uniref:hypothetical protein n=1 Tax=Streptomyces sp. TaxID=1931 RepID=UPI002810C3E2|nr:hypothetical protein [Streptomyces sp.]